MDETLKASLASIFRHLLTTAGGVLVAEGWITDAQLEQTAAGVAAIVIAVAWGIWQKKKAAK